MYLETRNLIEQFKKEGLYPGASYGFIRGKEIVSYRTGLAAVEPEKEPIQENQLYDVASLTKVMMTTIVVLQLIEEKKIAVDDALQKYLPDYSSADVTIRHLLTHTSDIHGYIPHRDTLPPEDLKKALMALPAEEKIGQEVAYTDTGLILLGFMIEVLEKEKLTDVFERRVIRPLNLKEATFFPKDAAQCAPTELHSKRGLIRGEVHDPKAFILKEHCGSAGLFSSLRDCLSFAQMMLNKGRVNEKRVLEEETVTDLLKDWTPNGKLHRSLGWDLKGNNQQPILFHSGFTGTFMLLDISQQEAFVFLSNRIHPKSDTPVYLEKRDQLVEAYLAEKERN